MDDMHFKSNEIEHFLSLLNEYTGKLRQLCEEQLQLRDRRRMSLAVFSVAAVLPVGLFLPDIIRASDNGELYFKASVLSISIIYIGLLLTLLRSRPQKMAQHDANQVARVVEHMVKIASQEYEHRNRGITEAFEFDLRLAEAEGALRLYQDVFMEGSNKYLSEKHSAPD